MHPLLSARAKAYGWDCVSYVGIAVLSVPFGLVFNELGWGAHRGFVFAVSLVPPLVATVVASRLEAGTFRGTYGKRRQGLTVVETEGGRLSLGRSLLRNAVKIAIPWQLGHVVAILAVAGGFEQSDPLTLTTTVATYLLLGAMVGPVALGSGRGLHDRLAGTRVCLAGSRHPDSG